MRIRAVGGGILGLVLAVSAAVAAAPTPERRDALVSSDHPLASRAGAEILAAGGNAVDAAVATALAAGVVQPAGSGLGGGGFAVWVDGDERGVLDFREVAPSAAHRDMFLTPEGEVDPAASRVGGLAVGVPGEGIGLARLVAEAGSLAPARVAAPAVTLASRGFPAGNHLAQALDRTGHADVQALFRQGERLPRAGEEIRNPALARTLRRWAATGGRAMHEGPAARAIAAAAQGAGGVLTVEDLEGYAPRVREPVVTTWQDHTVIGMPPPSSGGLVLGQLLRVLEGYDLAALGHNSSDYVHLLAEAMKHAYADRAGSMGDEDFVDVPREGLVSDARVQEIRGRIWPGRTFPPEWYGAPLAPSEDAGTQHISVMDAEGRAVALTTTINTSFGSGVVVESLGLVLNNEMDDFAAAPGVPNAFGLLGAEANAVAPGKRPLSSMTPTVILDPEGQPVIAIGGSGGSFIISATLQVLLNLVVFEMDPQQAVAAPRMHHQWMPDRLYLEPAFPTDVRRALEARGHTLSVRRGFSAVQVVVREEGAVVGGADPRKGGWPAGAWLRP